MELGGAEGFLCHNVPSWISVLPVVHIYTQSQNPAHIRQCAISYLHWSSHICVSFFGLLFSWKSYVLQVAGVMLTWTFLQTGGFIPYLVDFLRSSAVL